MIKYWLHPFHLFWLLLLLAAIAYLWQKRRLFKWLFLSAVALFFITSNSLLPDALLYSLERRYAPCCSPELLKDSLVYNIIVLGAGFTDNPRFPPNDQLSSTALTRLIEGIRIHRLLPYGRLVLSGPVATGTITQAEVFAQTAIALGVDTGAVALQGTPTNTYEETRAYVDAFGTDTPLIVVTSASHMPRAMMLFQRQGVNAIAAPTDFQLENYGRGRPSLSPSAANMHKMQVALIEYVGRWYWEWKLS